MGGQPSAFSSETQGENPQTRRTAAAFRPSYFVLHPCRLIPYFRPRCFFRAAAVFAAPLPDVVAVAVTTGVRAADEPAACGADLAINRGNSFRSPMPHKLEAMKYKHRPLATL